MKGRNKILLTSFLVILSVSLLGLVYAHWEASLYINGEVESGELDWEFAPGTVIHLDHGLDYNASNFPEVGAHLLDKDVGSTTVVLQDTDGDGDYDTLNVTLSNVYPWYYEHIAFKLHNNGEIPLKVWKVIIETATGNYTYYELNEQELNEGEYLDLDGDGKYDIVIWWGDNFGEQLHPCESVDISLDITVLQEAKMGTTYTFRIYIIAIQWNMYTPSPPV